MWYVVSGLAAGCTIVIPAACFSLEHAALTVLVPWAAPTPHDIRRGSEAVSSCRAMPSGASHGQADLRIIISSSCIPRRGNSGPERRVPVDRTSSVIRWHWPSVFISTQFSLICECEEKEIKRREHFVFLVRSPCEGISLSGAENPYQYDKLPPVIPDDSKYHGYERGPRVSARRCNWFSWCRHVELINSSSECAANLPSTPTPVSCAP